MNRVKIALLLLLPTAAFATSFVNRSLGVVLKEAPNIVRGTAGSSYAGWEDDAHQRIFTYTELSVAEEIKGKVNDTKILVRQPGGAKDGMEMSVSGVARFSPGQDVVLLLSEQNPTDKSYDVMNFATGKYDVQKNENGDLILVNSLGGEAIIDTNRSADTRSYNSQIDLETFRRYAQGSGTAEAMNQKQFSPSASAAPEGREDHAHTDPASSAKPSPATLAPSGGKIPEQTPQSESKRAWVIYAGIGAFALLVALFLLRR